MTEKTARYFRFIRFSLGIDDGEGWLSDDVQNGFDWNVFFRFAKEQTLAGIAFEGVQRLPKEQAPSKAVLMNWLMLSQALRQQNLRMNRATAYIYNKVCRAGLRCCILKGQGNALMYPDPHSRTPGDVDVWVNASRHDIRRLARMLAADGNGSIGEESRNHIEMTVNDISVELHSTPAIMNNPWHDHRMQQWLRRNADLQCSNVVPLPDDAGSVAVPTSAFNAVYQLFHLYHHYLYEGIGLRQFVDYYFVLKCLSTDSTDEHGWHEGLGEDSPTDFSESTDLGVLQRELKWLGLWKFAGAVMYVLHEVLGLPRGWMVAPMDERRGRLLLDEIMRGGNFGQHASEKRSGSMTWRHNVYRLQKDWRLMRYYPGECLAEPFYRLWHLVWRMKHR